jgi:hypothetical protein
MSCDRHFLLLGLLLLGCGSGAADAGESPGVTRRGLEELSAAEKKELQQKQESFDRLPAQEQERLRKVHAEITADPQAGHLEHVLGHYARWLNTLPSGQRADLLSRPPEERLAEIKRLLRQQETARLSSLMAQELSEEDLAAILVWLDDLLGRREQEILAKFPQLEPRLRHIEDPKRRRLVMYWMVRHDGTAQNLLRAEPSDLELLKQRVSPKARQVLDKAHDPESVAKLAARWMQAAMFSKRAVPPVDPAELTRFYKEDLKPEDREYLESLPAERMQNELTHRYLTHRFRQSSTGEMSPFFRPGGGPRGFGPFSPPGNRPAKSDRTPESRPDTPPKSPYPSERRWKSKTAGEPPR